MSSINILFYSNNCERSKYLISLLQGENLVKFFHLICTDNNPSIPPQITHTPTLIIKGSATPYVAGDAFAWFSKIKQWKINTMMQRISTSQQQYLQNANIATTDTTLLGFSKAEMEGMSDMFAYLHDDNAAPHSYVAYNNIGEDNIFTPLKEDKTQRLDEVKHKELYSSLEMQRKKQDDAFKQNIEAFRRQYDRK